MQQRTFETTLGGKTLSATFTDLADQANGSVLMRYGDTTVLVTAVMGSVSRNELSYVPLSVEFEERFYAAGMLLGSRFLRREGKPSDEAVLAGRLVDRTIRPLFHKALRRDVQVVVTVLSIGEDDPDVLGVVGASLALGVSDIPWGGPVSSVRVGKKRDEAEFVINPHYALREDSTAELDLVVCGNEGVVTMIEVAASEINEAVLVSALEAGLAEIEALQTFQQNIVRELGRLKVAYEDEPHPTQVVELFAEFAEEFPAHVFAGLPGRGLFVDYKERYLARVREVAPELARAADRFFEERLEALMRERALESGARVDGRGPEELRPLFAQAGGISSILHGSGIFYRGGTHIFSALTLGGPEESLLVDSIEGVLAKKRFIHHYNFPPFSVGDTGKFGGMNRRMVGHGALAEKALRPVLPPEETFPYTIRVVSEALASNGSTSMASVCASSLALMDGGVPITRPVAGIAVGVMYESPTCYRLLTDIQGPEDHHGDMDFKVAGTEVGVTAIQLDVKLEGVPVSVIREALEAGRRARLTILEVMKQALDAPRKELSPRAPRVISLTIPQDSIGLVIGTGGKTIKKIQEETGVDHITVNDAGTVRITGRSDATHRAAEVIRDLTRVFVEGEVLEGEVVRLAPFGAFVRLTARTEGLVHISEVAPFRIAQIEDALEVGEHVRVMVKEIQRDGRVSLSIKAADPEFAVRKKLTPEAPHAPHHATE